MSLNVKIIASSLAALIIGIAMGGYLFRNTQPRSMLALDRCEGMCMNANDLAGLVASVGIQNFDIAIPAVIETDYSIAIESPAKEADTHYVIFPKKDIKNIGSLAPEDQPYLVDTFAVINELVREQGLTKYQVVTNGPEYQHVTYLHFHLLATK